MKCLHAPANACALVFAALFSAANAGSILELSTDDRPHASASNLLAQVVAQDARAEAEGTWPQPVDFSTPTAAGTNTAAHPAEPAAPPAPPLDVDALLESIQRAYEHALPDVTHTPEQIAQFMREVRKQLTEDNLIPPLDPDAYRVRPLPRVTEAPQGPGTVRSDGDSSIMLTEVDGVPVYTFHDAAGNVLYEGRLATPEDRRNVPIEVWKELYPLEREAEREAREKEATW